MKIVIAFTFILLTARCYCQQITYKDLIGVWNGHWEIQDSTSRLPPGSMEFIDSVHATLFLWDSVLLKFNYKLIHSHGGVTSGEITYFNMSGLNDQNEYVKPLAFISKYGNDTLKIQWFINTPRITKNDTSKFGNTVIFVREKH
jgi:hypothetical protein